MTDVSVTDENQGFKTDVVRLRLSVKLVLAPAAADYESLKPAMPSSLPLLAWSISQMSRVIPDRNPIRRGYFYNAEYHVVLLKLSETAAVLATDFKDGHGNVTDYSRSMGPLLNWAWTSPRATCGSGLFIRLRNRSHFRSCRVFELARITVSLRSHLFAWRSSVCSGRETR